MTTNIPYLQKALDAGAAVREGNAAIIANTNDRTFGFTSGGISGVGGKPPSPLAVQHVTEANLDWTAGQSRKQAQQETYLA